MKLSHLILRSGLFDEIAPKQNKNNERYASDPVYRETRLKAAKTWNQRNAERKRLNDQRWASKNGADAARRYRQRQKAKAA